MTTPRLLAPLFRIRRSLKAALVKPAPADFSDLPEPKPATGEKDELEFEATAFVDLSYPIPLLAR
jgi:hypothetical protein